MKIKCKYKWHSRRDKTLVIGEYYYYELVNSCNFPYAVFNKDGSCINCYSKKDFSLYFITMKELRKQKLEKINGRI